MEQKDLKEYGVIAIPVLHEYLKSRNALGDFAEIQRQSMGFFISKYDKPMTFGKYKGMTLPQVMATDFGYLHYLATSDNVLTYTPHLSVIASEIWNATPHDALQTVIVHQKNVAAQIVQQQQAQAQKSKQRR